MNYNLTFVIALSSLSIIILYAILVFRNVTPLIAIIICVILGFIYNKSTPVEIGNIIATSLGGFLGLVGFIIMLGAGFGEVLNATKVSHCLVYTIVYKIGIATKMRFKIGVILSSIVIVGILGTLAGGLAILAPILRPIAGKVGLSKPSLAVLMQASGEEALILGPFAPPVIALLGVVNISYPQMLLKVALPISFVTIIVTWIMSDKLQKKYANELFIYDNEDATFIPNRHQKLTTLCFLLGFSACIIYGLSIHAKTSFVVFVMLFLAMFCGVIGKLPLSELVGLLIKGMQRNLHIFLMFVLLDPLLILVGQAGGFNALNQLFTHFNYTHNTPMIPILTGLTGAFGMPAASVAVIQLLNKLFATTANLAHVPIFVFAFSLLLATRITNFVYPGPNMFAAMGFADSNNVKAMIKNGLVVATTQVFFLISYCYMFS
jgi:H+/gluconate symporter-like permease